jgi:GNAT superfamily N-acetyltransferase
MASDIRVFLDRSRDGLRGDDWLGLHEDERFRVTENYRRVSAAALAACDVVVIQTLGVSRYGAAEMAAVRSFVERGGGLLLSTSAALFELGVRRPMRESTAQQVADLFGVRFLSPGDAQAETVNDEALNRGYRRDDLELLPAATAAHGPLPGFPLDDLVLQRALPLALPHEALPLVRHAQTAEPVIAALTFGRGRVIISGSLEFGRRSGEMVSRPVVQWLADSRGKGRLAQTKPLPDLLGPVWRRVRRGDFEVRSAGVRPARVAEIVAVARTVAKRLQPMFSRRWRGPWRFEVLPGVGSQLDWSWQSTRRVIRLGADLCPAALTYELAWRMAQRLLGNDAYRQWLNRSLGWDVLNVHLALTALEGVGFKEESSARRAALTAWPDAPRPGLDPRAIDLGRWYPETGPTPALYIWRELEAEYGPDLVRRFLRLQPAKVPWDKFDWDYVTPFDVLVYYLSLAAKRDLFDWFEKRGTTVHRLPLLATDDKGYDRERTALLRAAVRDRRRRASDRADAVQALIRRANEAKRRLADDVRALSRRSDADRLVAAVRLARVRDHRGATELGRLACQTGDEGLAAIAARMLAELDDAAAVDRLAELAPRADTRFRVDAQAVLACAGRRAEPLFSVVAHRNDQVRLLALVDDYAVANVFSSHYLQRWPHGTVVPEFFVHWVHTSPRWRRAGLSRALFQRAMDDRWTRAAPVSRLWTGTTNTAHTLYRSAGFIDLYEAESYSRSLKDTPPAPAVKGVRFRAAADRDAPRLTDLFNRVYRDHLLVGRRRTAPLAEDGLVIVAEKKGALVGYMAARVGDPNGRGQAEATLREMCLLAGDDTEDVARSLAARLAALARRRGAVSIHTWNPPEDEAVRRGLMGAGFASRKTTGVAMWRLASLPGLLTHLVPLLEYRLREGRRDDWCGTIAFQGEQHQAALEIKQGRVTVRGTAPPTAEIALHARDDALSRLVVGRQTAFQAMLQLELRIAPKANEDVTRLLEVLFPRVLIYLW